MLTMNTENPGLPADLVSVREAAETAGVSERDIRNWIAARKFPRYRKGDFWVLVSLEDVLQFVERRKRIERAPE